MSEKPTETPDAGGSKPNPAPDDSAKAQTVKTEAIAGAQADTDEVFPEIGRDDKASTVIESMVGEQMRQDRAGRNIDALFNVGLSVQIILGHSRMPIAQLLKLSRGSVIELDKKIGEPVDVVINDRLVARGDLIKVGNDRIGVTLTEIVKDYVSDL